MSPGVPTDLPFVNELRDEGLPIWGEIELAYRCKKGDVLAITGTNGKTTTTALLGEIMKTTYPHVHVVGNIGIPYTGLVAEDTDDTVTVAEMQQLSAGDHRYFLSGSICNLKYYARSSEPSPYNG